MLLSSSYCLFGQQLPFQQYTPDNGLPSNYLYHIVQDQEGFLWITSEAEVCKFNGQQFIKAQEEVLQQNEIIRMYFSKPNRLFFIDLKNHIYVHEQDSLIRLNDNWFSKGRFMNSIHEDKNKNIWILSEGSNKVSIVNRDSILFENAYHIIENKLLSNSKAFIPIDSNTTFLVNEKGVFEFKGKTLTHVDKHSYSAIFHSPCIKMPNEEEYLIPTLKGNLYLFSIKTKKLRRAFEEFSEFTQVGINNIFQDHLNNIWIASREGLLLLTYQKEGSYTISRHLQNSNVGYITQDKNKNYWVTTLTDGLFFLPSTEIKVYNHPKWNKTTAIGETATGNIVLGTEGSQMIVLDEHLNYLFEKKLQKKSLRIYDIKSHNDLISLSCSSKILTFDKNWNITSTNNGSFKQISVTNDDKIWFGRSTGMGYLEKNKSNFLGNIRTYSIYPSGSNTCYFGTVEGLFYFDGQKNHHLSADLIKDDIRHLSMTKDSVLCLSTQGNGLIFYKDGVVQKHLKTDDGLLSDNCKFSLIDNQILWLATNRGLNKIYLSDYSILSLTQANGLPNDEVNYLYLKKDTLLVATNKGLCYFNKNIALEESPPNLYFAATKIANRDTTILPQYDLKFSQNNLNINYSAIQFTNANSIQYQYKMKGLNDNWVTTFADEIQYPSLNPGNYIFSLRAKSINSDWSKPIGFKLNIDRPFWSKWWFRGLCLLAGLCLMFLIAYSIVQNNKRKSAIQSQIKESQLQALRVQMNPHFLFNSLNSIQEFIMLQDKRAANKYLGQFSKLMRTILNMSDKERISLEEEIDALQLYLSLEVMRFEDAFEYDIKLRGDFSPAQISIPPMLIQPYVENAILHGLNPKEGEKVLDISFSFQDKTLICSITDNGIGREKALAIKQKKISQFPSKGTSLTEKRLRLLNAAYKQNLNVETIDLKDEFGNAAGTKVILYIVTKQFNLKTEPNVKRSSY